MDKHLQQIFVAIDIKTFSFTAKMLGDRKEIHPLKHKRPI